MIRAVSFDIWGTLVAAPPELPQLLVSYFANRTADDPAEISQRITTMGKEFDRAAIRSGRDIPSREKLLRLAKALGVTDLSGDELEGEVRRHIKEAPPYLIEPTACIDVWKYLRSNGIEVMFASNSGFVSGAIMRVLLRRLRILGNQDRCVFSDGLGRAKPSLSFFRAVTGGHAPSTIVHIGDNFDADIAGAHAAGMTALHYLRREPITDSLTQIPSIAVLPDMIGSPVGVGIRNIAGRSQKSSEAENHAG